MSTYTINFSLLQDYLNAISIREPQILTELREETAALPQAEMQIAPLQGQFMSLLVELLQPKKILELGVFTGYSSLVMALAASSETKITACDLSKAWTDIARKYWERAGVHSKINLHLAPALDTLDKLLEAGEGNTYDLAFIDADKRNYDFYYEKTLALLKSGGVMLIDNVMQDGRVADDTCQDEVVNIIRALNKKIHRDDRVSISVLPIADGLTVVRKK